MPKLKTPRELVQEQFNLAKRAVAVSIEPSSLIIQGGRISAEKLDAFLIAWQAAIAAHLHWSMVEEVSRFYVAKPLDVAKLDVSLLERLRCFGPHGDLDLRRDGATCYWRFIGDAGKGDPAWPAFADWGGQDFWQANPGTVLTPIKHEYYQWRRGDERTGLDMTPQFTSLANSSFENELGIMLHQIHYLIDGSLAFVRFTHMQEEQTS